MDLSGCAVPGPEIDLLALDEALDALQARDRRAAEGVSTANADNDWAYAKSFQRVRLAPVDDDRP